MQFSALGFAYHFHNPSAHDAQAAGAEVPKGDVVAAEDEDVEFSYESGCVLGFHGANSVTVHFSEAPW
jgi:hypothetical protein